MEVAGLPCCVNLVTTRNRSSGSNQRAQAASVDPSKVAIVELSVWTKSPFRLLGLGEYARPQSGAEREIPSAIIKRERDATKLDPIERHPVEDILRVRLTGGDGSEKVPQL